MIKTMLKFGLKLWKLILFSIYAEVVTRGENIPPSLFIYDILPPLRELFRIPGNIAGPIGFGIPNGMIGFSTGIFLLFTFNLISF
jgi:hypothetical protein